IARRVGMKLRIGAKVDPVDRVYYEEQIAPLFKKAGSLVEFIGEVGGKDKDEFLGNAYALLFPIGWPEPFGLVMIESIACGTPVIAFRCGSVPEVMDDGLTGFVVDDVDEAVQAVGRVGEVSRGRCCEVFEQRFSVERMAGDYLKVYRRLAERYTASDRALQVFPPLVGSAVSDRKLARRALARDTISLDGTARLPAPRDVTAD